MIHGIGTDIVSINRIDTIYSEKQESFVKKILTVQEQKQFSTLSEHKKTSYLASRWAAKEAVVKSLGTGFKDGIYLSEITIANMPSGKPHVSFSKSAINIVNSLLLVNNNESYNIHLSLSHEKDYATAFVVVEVFN